MTANAVSFARILLTPLIIALLLVDQNVPAFLVFILAAFLDALDGYLARRFNQVSELGKFLDPLADKLLVTLILITLVETRGLAALPVIIIVGRELVVSGFRIQRARAGNVLAASKTAKIKTFAQLIAVGMLIMDLPFASAVLWLAVALSVLSGVEYAGK